MVKSTGRWISCSCNFDPNSICVKKRTKNGWTKHISPIPLLSRRFWSDAPRWTIFLSKPTRYSLMVGFFFVADDEREWWACWWRAILAHVVALSTAMWTRHEQFSNNKNTGPLDYQIHTLLSTWLCLKATPVTTRSLINSQIFCASRTISRVGIKVQLSSFG